MGFRRQKVSFLVFPSFTGKLVDFALNQAAAKLWQPRDKKTKKTTAALQVRVRREKCAEFILVVIRTSTNKAASRQDFVKEGIRQNKRWAPATLDNTAYKMRAKGLIYLGDDLLWRERTPPAALSIVS
jgi:hypothetical protein